MKDRTEKGLQINRDSRATAERPHCLREFFVCIISKVDEEIAALYLLILEKLLSCGRPRHWNPIYAILERLSGFHSSPPCLLYSFNRHSPLSRAWGVGGGMQTKTISATANTNYGTPIIWGWFNAHFEEGWVYNNPNKMYF